MPVMRTLQCPSCQGTFDHLFMSSDDAPPRYCQLCGFDTHKKKRGRPRKMEVMLSAPKFQSRKTKGVDDHYRAMEEGSNHRAELAKSLGADEQTANDLKITNLKPGQQGEAANVPVVNEVTKAMDLNNAHKGDSTGFAMSQVGAQYAAQTSQGPHARQGMRAQDSLRSIHAQKHPNAVSVVPVVR